MLLYRKALDLRDRVALASFSATELPLVVAITTIAIDKGEMRPTTAASLVGAAVLSTAIFPLVGLRLRGSQAQARGRLRAQVELVAPSRSGADVGFASVVSLGTIAERSLSAALRSSPSESSAGIASKSPIRPKLSAPS